MARTALVAAFAVASLASLVAPAALAQELPAPPPASGSGTTVIAPPGSGGVTVVAPTPGGGSVTATGCTSVMVNGSPTLVAPGGGPCPTYAPYQPYQPPAPAYAYDIRPRYARDPDRSAALIGASLVFGIGGGTAGVMYLTKLSNEHCTYSAGSGSSYSSYNCTKEDPRGWLYTYGALVTFTPSVPRFIMGDHAKGLIYTAIRGGAFASAVLIDWGKDSSDNWTGPFLLGFCAPITLGIIDLATTPHREDMEPTAGITGISPVALSDKQHGTHGGMLSVQGIF